MRDWKSSIFQLLLIFVVYLSTGCTHSVVNSDKSKPHISSEKWVSLKYTFPPAQNWSTEKLTRAREYANEIGSSSVIVIYNGKLVAEWGDTSKRIKSHSVRKSLLSALYGIAVEKKLIDLDATMDELGIDDTPPSLTEEEKQAKVSDLLKARSGIYHPAAKESSSMKKKRPKRGSHPPGTHWYYNNWDFNVLGTIFENKTGMTIGIAFQEWIAKPIGMEDFRAEDVIYEKESISKHSSYPFWISARDLARFGVLYLNEGEWDGRQVIPAHWIKESTSAKTQWEKGGYGYMWWITQTGDYFASGFGGHYLGISPKRRLVIVNRVDTGAEGRDRITWYLFGKKVSMDEFSKLVNLILEACPPI
jgi:CubicO group peptidase (beta-lactamase class C family)